MLAALKQVRDVDYLHTCGGICGNAQSALIFNDVSLLQVTLFLAPYFVRWPKFSGDPDYPVPHPEKGAYVAYLTARKRFDQNTEYGRNRWELLHFLIEELEKEIHNDHQD